jgi:hypothetical protein
VVSEQLSLPFGTMLPFTSSYEGENSYQNPGLSNPSKKRFTTYDRSEATGLDYAVNRLTVRRRADSRRSIRLG